MTTRAAITYHFKKTVMNKNIKDYLHLYLGCDVSVRKKNRIEAWQRGRISEVSRNSNHGDWIEVWFPEVITITNEQWEDSSSNAHNYFIGYDEIKLILRPLSDMTEEEMKQVAWLQFNYKAEDVRGKDRHGNIKVVNKSPFYYWINPIRNTNPETTLYLLSKHFDLFGLIEDGLAIGKPINITSVHL